MRGSILLAVAIGCAGGDKSADSGPTTATPNPGTPVGSGTGTATGTGSGVEDCTDGVDNDNDGLLDCEDDDCASDPACFESDCADGLDNDGDGREDCTDEDCWGNGCQVSIARLAALTTALTRSRFESITAFGSPACSSTTSHFSFDMRIQGVEGTVQFLPATGGAWTTCDWSASTSAIVFDNVPPPYAGPQPVTRYGFQIDPGCPLQTSGFLPAYWELDTTVGGQLEFTTRPSGNGPVWWSIDPVLGYGATYASGTSVTPGSPCSTNTSYNQGTASWFGGTPGSAYTQVSPQ